MDANLLVFGYLFLRLAPFILACFFTLASLFNSDYKGIIYLGGLIITSVVTMMVSKIPPVNMLPHLDNSPEICRLFSLAQTDDLSALPLGQAMLTFTFGYLL